MSVSDEMRRKGLAAIRQAEYSEAHANKRRDQICDEALRQLQQQAYVQLPWWRRAMTKPEDITVDPRLLKATTAAWTANDPRWKTHVADNRWHLDQATAYGVIAGGAS